MRRVVVKWGAVLAVAAAGCATYRPEPLVPAEEWARLQAVQLNALTAPEAERAGADDGGQAAADYAGGLTMDDAAALALVLNPEIRVVRQEEGIAQAQLLAAGLLPNPTVETRWLDPDEGSSLAGEVNVLFNVTDAVLLRGLEQSRARLEMEAVRWDVAEREWELVFAVRLAFVDVLYWDEAVSLHTGQRQVAERTHATVLARLAAGAATEIEALVANADVAELEREGAQIRGNRRQALQELNRLLGLPPNHATELRAPGSLRMAVRIAADRDELLERLPDRRPAVLRAKHAYEIAESALQIAVRQQVPDVEIGPSYEREEGSNAFGVAVAVELPLFNRNQGDIAIRRAEREQRRREYIAQLHKARSEFHEAWAAMETAEAQLVLYHERITPTFERSLELTEQAFAAGEFDLFQLLVVQGRVLRSQRETLDRVRDLQRARLAALRAVGPTRRDIPD